MARFGVFLSRGRLGNYDANSSLASGCNGGREGARTPDLLVANEALSQLSYTPTDLTS
jgi:hypothetical protein